MNKLELPYKIITHDGKAHMDELLGSALFALHMGEEPESVERTDSRVAADMVRDGNIPADACFIDCGLVYDSAGNLFDHHQNGELDSAALLIFNEFFPHLKGTDLHKYLELVSKVDTRSPMALDDFDVVSESRDYLSFSQGILLKAFQDDPMPVLRIFIRGLEDRISFEKAKAEACLWLETEGHIDIVRVGALNVMRYLVKPPSGLVSPLRSAVGSIIDENNIAAILSFDDRIPEALTLYRTDTGHDLVDFSRCKPSETLFNHPGGFLLKFIPADDEEWFKLVKQSDCGG